MVDKIDPSKLKVSELKAELTNRGADSSGLKNDLITRLQQILDDEEEFGDIPGVEEDEVAPEADAAPEPAKEEAKEEVKEKTPTTKTSKAKEEKATSSKTNDNDEKKETKTPSKEPFVFEPDEETKILLEKAEARSKKFGIPNTLKDKIMKDAEDKWRAAIRAEKKAIKNAAFKEKIAKKKEEKALKRAAREAEEVEKQKAIEAEDAKKRKRAERFGNPTDEMKQEANDAKKAKRKERFGSD